MDDKDLLAVMRGVDTLAPGLSMMGMIRSDVCVSDYQSRLLVLARAVERAIRNECKYPACEENEDERCPRWLTGECAA